MSPADPAKRASIIYEDGERTRRIEGTIEGEDDLSVTVRSGSLLARIFKRVINRIEIYRDAEDHEIVRAIESGLGDHEVSRRCDVTLSRVQQVRANIDRDRGH